jgi:hypothetical protein
MSFRACVHITYGKLFSIATYSTELRLVPALRRFVAKARVEEQELASCTSCLGVD